MTTHDHVESVKGSVVLAVSIWMLLHNYSKDEVFEYCKEHYCCSQAELDKNMYKWCYFHLNTIPAFLSNKEDNASLFTNHTVPYAIKCFYSTNSFEKCMRLILSHFGDTDTACAIAGTLCYACYGETGFDIDNILEKQNLTQYF
jgi:ADP-ribosylglycohydrolase